jgi:hypothetical protein
VWRDDWTGFVQVAGERNLPIAQVRLMLFHTERIRRGSARVHR